MASFLQGICVLYAAIMCITFWLFYRLYYPIPCPSDSRQCLQNYVAKTPHPMLKLWVYLSRSQDPHVGFQSLALEINDFKPYESVTRDIEVFITSGLLYYTDAMYAHVFVAPVEGGRGEESPYDADWMVHQTGILTTYPTNQEQVAHWRSSLTLSVMTDDVTFDSEDIPRRVMDYIRLYWNQYLPILIIDEVNIRNEDLLPLNNYFNRMPLRISYKPISYGKFRLWLVSKEIFNQTWPSDDGKLSAGVTEKEGQTKDYYMYIIARFPHFALIMAFKLLFVLLLIESYISFWEGRKTMGGLSTQTVVWSSVSEVVGVLYTYRELQDLFEYTMLIVAIAEIWTLSKIFKPRIYWTEWRLVFDNAVVGDKERKTQELDSQAMRYLSYVLYPSWAAVISYSLKKNFDKGNYSWWSVCLQSLYYGFYSFGFLYKLPQIFINYKLKSVSDLPGKVLMLKAFITFSDDICLSTGIPLSTLPTETDYWISFQHHVRHAIYIYQRWLYPV